MKDSNKRAQLDQGGGVSENGKNRTLSLRRDC